MRLQLLTLILLSGCLKPDADGPSATDDTGVPAGDDTAPGGDDSDDSEPVDNDGDGYTSEIDCDDDNFAINPGAEEVCNGLDDDCDGEVDDGDDASTWYDDVDGDGFGDDATAQAACEAPNGTVSAGGDCDDNDARVYPGADEVFDGVDDDCDGDSDVMRADEVSGWTILGEQADDSIGEVLLTGEDIDSDGATDLLIGAPLMDFGGRQDKGGLGIHDADNQGLGRTLNEGWVLLVGESSDDRLGASVAWLGEVDSDPADELAVGGAWANEGGFTDSGHATYADVQGLSGIVTYDSSVIEGSYYGRRDYAYGGTSMASGDINGDGVSDLLVGAPGDDQSKGRPYVMMGDGGLAAVTQELEDGEYHLHGEDSGDELGSAVMIADLNGDSYGDLLICAGGQDGGGSNAGTCFLIEGQAALSGHDDVSDDASARFVGAGSNEGLGAVPGRVAVVDADADGNNDLAFGVPGDDSTGSDGGAVWLFLGSDAGYAGSASINDAELRVNGRGELGAAVLSSGDHDGDGRVDLLVGSPTYDGAGAVFLINLSGRSGSFDIQDEGGAVWLGEASGDRFGAGLGGTVNLDGDSAGALDFVAGAPLNDENAEDAGKVYVLPGLR